MSAPSPSHPFPLAKFASAVTLGIAGLLMLMALHYRPPAASVLQYQAMQASATSPPLLRGELFKGCRTPPEPAPRTRQRRTALRVAT